MHIMSRCSIFRSIFGLEAAVGLGVDVFAHQHLADWFWCQKLMLFFLLSHQIGD